MRLLLISILLLASCSDVNFSKTPSSGAAQQNGPVLTPEPVQTPPPAHEIIAPHQDSASTEVLPAPMIVEHEGVAAPNQINGALLRCGVAMEARDAAVNSMIGCRFENAAGERILASTLAFRHEFRVLPLSYATSSVTQKTVGAYDAWIEFRAGSVADANRAANEARITVALFDEAGVNTATVGAVVKDVSQVLPPNEWKKNQISTYTVYQHERTGLSWDLGRNQQGTQGVGISSCEDSMHGFMENWRLPTLTELRMASADGLEGAKGTTYVTTEFWSSTSAVDAGSAYSVLVQSGPSKGAVTVRPKGNSMGVLCVHD